MAAAALWLWLGTGEGLFPSSALRSILAVDRLVVRSLTDIPPIPPHVVSWEAIRACPWAPTSGTTSKQRGSSAYAIWVLLWIVKAAGRLMERQTPARRWACPL